MSRKDGWTHCSSRSICSCVATHSTIYCSPGLGLGLALWKGADGYEDVKSLAYYLNKSLVSALTNNKKVECNGLYNSTTSCDAQLVRFINIFPSSCFYYLTYFRVGNKENMAQRKYLPIVKHMEGKSITKSHCNKICSNMTCISKLTVSMHLLPKPV